jgi:uncharacterized HhH-GPD family protein
MPKIFITGNPTADRLLERDPLALVIGMLLDQQVPMEWAFRGPLTLQQRLGSLNAADIAAMPVESLEEVFREKPAMHRYPGSMARRTHALCQHVVDHYRGDAKRIWKSSNDPAVVFEQIAALPGFGTDKAQIFLAMLAKRLGAAPPGWEPFAGRFGGSGFVSVADIDSPDAIEKVREFKKQLKSRK